MKVATNAIKICIRFVPQTQTANLGTKAYRNLLLYLKGLKALSPPAAPTCCLKVWVANQKTHGAKGVKQPLSDRINWEQVPSSLCGFIILRSLVQSYSV